MFDALLSFTPSLKSFLCHFCVTLLAKRIVIYVHSDLAPSLVQTDFTMRETTAEQPTPNIFGLITPEQFAKQMNVTVRTLQQWNAERTGPPRVTVGRQIFYKVTSVQAWLETREQRKRRA